MENNENNIDQTVHEAPVHPVTETHKPSRSALVLLLVVVAAMILLFTTSKMPKEEVVTEVPQDSQLLCYYGSAATASGSTSTYALKLAVSGTKATGELITAPAEKDSQKGTLEGSIVTGTNERIFDGMFDYTGEGMQNREQRIIRLSDTQALVGYGDVTENTDGSYSYTDTNAINYSLKIPRVDCALYDTSALN